MAPTPSYSLFAVRKQHLLVEFSGLKYACPHGVFMSLTPGDPTLWSGVMFIRKGPYAPSVLRFQISFPPSYPSLPPLVTFSTDIFHPLVTPLTTYMYTTDIQDGGTVSATDEERLPPGGFSLRGGFPSWFGRTQGRGPRSTTLSPTSTPLSNGSRGSPSSLSPSASQRTTVDSPGGQRGPSISAFEVLRYIRTSFDEEEVLDQIPLEAAGNPGAWHAWRAYRQKAGVDLPPAVPPKDKINLGGTSGSRNVSNSSSTAPEGYQSLAGGTSASTAGRRPGEWNWEGVWEVRARKGIDGSVSDAALFGKDVGDDLIHFLNLDENELESIRGSISAFAKAEPQRRGII